ncbi:hypothetical protein FOZ63_032027 [Perkinsus olseni]|uniref:Uncharacterized protein n=1 Tax=Perkinsus olseni TaxID=32597 RepID=A0A7J6QLZ5_PEROL|nr:hypothetical protein FOZ63_032027 [Perkinsus olseni]
MEWERIAEVANNGLDVQVVKPGNVTFYFMKRTSAEDKAAPDAKRYDKNSLVSQTLRAADVGELIRSSCENVRITDKWHPENYLAVEKDISETHQHEVRRFTIQKVDESSQSVSCTLEEMLALQKMLEWGLVLSTSCFHAFTERERRLDPSAQWSASETLDATLVSRGEPIHAEDGDASMMIRIPKQPMAAGSRLTSLSLVCPDIADFHLDIDLGSLYIWEPLAGATLEVDVAHLS